jgi:hypothetical protein
VCLTKDGKVIIKSSAAFQNSGIQQISDLEVHLVHKLIILEKVAPLYHPALSRVRRLIELLRG